MNKISAIISFAVILLIGLFSLTRPVFASDIFDPGKQLQESACVNVVGEPVIDVRQHVLHDADSAVGGNFWALDKYNRKIVVYQTSTANTYCAIVTYDGNFVTFLGNSPQGTGTVSAGIKGDMSGGRRATIVGVLNPTPSVKTKGNLGTYDYNCDSLGNCPGYVSWVSLYFTSTSSYNDDWWGWKYTTEHNGTWINAISGNVGDITGVLVNENNDNHKGNQ